MRDGELQHYAETAVLRDGGSLLVRAIEPADKSGLRALFGRLSVESVRHRVFGVKTSLTDAELTYLTEVDFVNHVALAAILREDGAEQMVGVGRYIRTPDKGGTPHAEVAFTVVDQHQGRGIGTVLLEHLARIALDAGVGELDAEVMADNAGMLHVFTRSGFVVRRSVEYGVYSVAFMTTATAAFIHASDERERQAAAESVRVFFEPSAVAVIGASRRAGSVGGVVLANLKERGFRGPIYPIHREAHALEGLPCFTSVSVTPTRVDLAVISVPAADVEGVVLECARAGVRGVIVISAGFAEVSKAGRIAQDRLRRVVRTAGMRLVGPNAVGVLNTASAFSLDATVAATRPSFGNVSLLTQGGALGSALLDEIGRLDIGLANFISVGNKADVSGNDLLSYWAGSPQTGVIALYLETFGNPRKFARAAYDVGRQKPIVIVKSGRSVAVDALLASAGVVRSRTLEGLFDVVALLSTQPLPGGARVGVVTNAASPALLLVDACAAHGLVIPTVIDLFASATPHQYEEAIGAVADDPNVDIVVVVYIPPIVTRAEEVAVAIARAAGRLPPHKPLATVFMSSQGTPAILATGPRGKLPSYRFPENAAIALGAVARYATWRRRPPRRFAVLEYTREREIRQLVEALRASNPSPFWVAKPELDRILALAGLRTQLHDDKGIEMVVAVTVDPELGALLAVGFGGPHAEPFHDVAARLTPVSDLDARALLDELRASAVLDGVRGAPAFDRGALVTMIERVSALVEILPDLVELTLDPVRVLAEGKGVVALGARLSLTAR